MVKLLLLYAISKNCAPSREAGINSSARLKNPLGVVATEECPLAMVLFLEMLHLLQPPNLS